MNKRMIKKLAKKAEVEQVVSDAELEVKDLTQTVDFMVGKVAELEGKCTRYVEEAMRYKSLYESIVDRTQILEEDLKVAGNANATYINQIAELKIMNKQQKAVKNTYFNALNKSIEDCSRRSDENEKLALNYKGCADRLDKSEKARRLSESERDYLKQKISNLEAEINKPWWKKVFSWL